jgi:hypothetical protein
VNIPAAAAADKKAKKSQRKQASDTRRASSASFLPLTIKGKRRCDTGAHCSATFRSAPFSCCYSYNRLFFLLTATVNYSTLFKKKRREGAATSLEALTSNLLLTHEHLCVFLPKEKERYETTCSLFSEPRKPSTQSPSPPPRIKRKNKAVTPPLSSLFFSSLLFFFLFRFSLVRPCRARRTESQRTNKTKKEKR